MAPRKKAVQQLSTLGKDYTRKNLRRYFPWLNDDFRLIKKEEQRSKEVFQELFPNEKNDFSKLYALYTYQQCDTKTREI